MKFTYVPVFIFMLMISACSKEANTSMAVPKMATHMVRIKITADADFSVTVTARKAEDNMRAVIDDKVTTMGTYEVTTSQLEGNFLYAEVKSSTATKISYVVYNDDKVVAQQTDKALNARLNIEYEIR